MKLLCIAIAVLTVGAAQARAGEHFRVIWDIAPGRDRIVVLPSATPLLEFDAVRDFDVGLHTTETSGDRRLRASQVVVADTYDFARQRKILDRLSACAAQQTCVFKNVEPDRVYAAVRGLEAAENTRFAFECPSLLSKIGGTCAEGRSVFPIQSILAISESEGAHYTVEWSETVFPVRNALQRRFGRWPGRHPQLAVTLSVWPQD